MSSVEVGSEGAAATPAEVGDFKLEVVVVAVADPGDHDAAARPLKGEADDDEL